MKVEQTIRDIITIKSYYKGRLYCIMLRKILKNYAKIIIIMQKSRELVMKFVIYI